MSTSLETFVSALIESGLYSQAEVDDMLRALPVDRPPQDGRQFADELVRENKLTPYQAEQIAAGHGSSLVLGAYVILDRIAHGGMGVVYRAQHRRMKRVVALKVLAPQVTETPQAHRRFHREVEAAAKLSHPNIVIAYDAGEAQGQHFLVMEYVDGVDLASYVKQHGPLPFCAASRIVLQAAHGLDAAHQHGVVHRDVKPNNLLLTRSGIVKILDMGLALLDSESAQHDDLTGVGQIVGTVDYMAPEQARSTRHADQRADIYGLGATLWYLLTGRAMHPGETVVERLLAHQTEPIPQLGDFGAIAPAEFQAVFAKMVAKRPEERYETMRQVIAAVEKYQEAAGPKSAEPAVGSAADHHDTPWGAGSGSGSLAAGAPSPMRMMDGRRTIVPDGSPPSGNEPVVRPPLQESMATTVEMSSPNKLSGWLRVPRRLNRRTLAVACGVVVLGILSYAFVKIVFRDGTGSESELQPAVREVELLPLVNSSVLGDGRFQNVEIRDDSLILDATGESPQLWLNFQEVAAEEMTIRTQLRVSNGKEIAFFKLVFKGLAEFSNCELYAILLQDTTGRNVIIESTSPFAHLASYATSDNLGAEFIDLAVDVRSDTVRVLLDGAQVLQARRPQQGPGYVALAAAGWRVELRRPRTVLYSSASSEKRP
jgi:serine/threonine protein kinase